MAPELVAAREQDSLADILDLTQRAHARHLPVLDADGMLVGLLSLDGVLAILASGIESMAQAIGTGVSPPRIEPG